ncbi:MAG: tetratricopeptide repeat protein [Chitinophagaceae bacterium]|nr:MAG: tetratricopeptide repeat protein [Chitinophagaceae bacterium]
MNLKEFTAHKNFWPVLLGILSVLLYVNTLGNGYNLDDELVVHHHPQVTKGVHGIYDILTTQYIEGGQFEVEYRPITQVTFALEYSLYGENLFMFHFWNVMLYCVNILLLFYFLKFLFGPKYLHFIGCCMLLFVAHPTHTEVVASLKNREELITFMFGVLSAISFFKFLERDSYKFLFAGLLFFIIALMTKMSVTYFIVITPFVYYLFRRNKLKQSIAVGGLQLITFLIYFATVSYVFDGISRDLHFPENPLVFETSLGYRLGLSFNALIYYVKLLFIPWPLGFFYGYNVIPLETFGSPLSLFSFLFFTSIFIIAVYQFNRDKILSFSIFIFLFSIFPFSNLPIPHPGIIADRVLYLPSLGMAVFLPWLMAKILGKLPESISIRDVKFFAPIICIVIIFSFLTITRNTHWKDKYTLYSNDIVHLSESYNANRLLAHEYQHMSEREEDENVRAEYLQSAIFYYKEASRVMPFTGIPHLEIGYIYDFDFDRCDLAIEYYIRALDFTDHDSTVYYDLALCYENLGNLPAAIENLEQYLTLYPENARAFYDLGRIYLFHGDLFSATAASYKAIEFAPDRDYGYMNLGAIYMAQGDTATAVEFYRQALKVNPDHPALIEFLSQFE